MKKEVIDKCHICGKITKLTKEHFPPKAAYNNIPRKLVNSNILAMSVEDDWSMKNKRYKSYQQGISEFTLCERCNNLTGAMYGDAYSKVVKGVGYHIMQIPKEKRTGWVHIAIQQINCLAFFKQVLIMVCSVNYAEFGVKFKDYLLDKSNKNFDTQRYKLSMYLHHGNMDRMVSMCQILTPQTHTITKCTEISLFPFGFVFYDLDHTTGHTIIGTDITSWSQSDFIEKNIEIELPFLICNTGRILEFE